MKSTFEILGAGIATVIAMLNAIHLRNATFHRANDDGTG
jgi:hypothetical protein